MRTSEFKFVETVVDSLSTFSVVFRPSDKPKIDQIFPKSELVYLDAGHWIHAEKPEEFMNLVLNFVNKV